MMPAVVAWVGLIFALATLVPARVARAEEPTEASDAYAEGRRRFGAGDFAGSLAPFQRALALTGSPNARLYVARALAELGRHAEAYEELAATVQEATRLAETDTKYVPTRDAAAAELALLERHVGRLVVALDEAPPGAAVTLDGRPIAENRLGRVIAVEPGPHTVVATAPGRPRAERRVRLAGGETASLALSLKARPRLVESGGLVRTIGFVPLGIGVAGMVAFATTAALAQDRFDTLEAQCGDRHCTDPATDDIVSEGRSLETAANATLAVGIIGLVAGAGMILFGGPTETVVEDARLELRPSPGGGAIAIGGAF
jgi:hypothetical protein